jgi:hypothetical protein
MTGEEPEIHSAIRSARGGNRHPSSGLLHTNRLIGPLMDTLTPARRTSDRQFERKRPRCIIPSDCVRQTREKAPQECEAFSYSARRPNDAPSFLSKKVCCCPMLSGLHCRARSRPSLGLLLQRGRSYRLFLGCCRLPGR